ncbi:MULTISPECIES: SDR family oxidoreductase [Catenuloplanes]|uniref:NAD(P)-dependent dehydrogenase (Short-subunit alcohol dehydrogenase family) n=1 Tax=Catenuloplanes niger TaxID=587534 RepID=A0AAE4D0V0_9ACTN|nr:SDR family oxidoreductase [Catenuloplanes niger]MDR7328304.1 NAD(P)-dependent dehydrogenase (short-subunit alcohol dehydrogenase family) [Catenuloplanes niger]
MSDTGVVLVTGAGSGFGRLTVEALVRRGHTVFAGMREPAGRNRAAAAALTGARVIELDVTDQDSATRAVETVIGEAGRLDVVINNAGQVFAGPVEAYTAEEAMRQLDVNVLGALRVNRAAIPHLRRQGHGLLIQVGSTADRVTVPFTGLYGASKAALASLTEAWRYDLAGTGVESVSVSAAPHDTELGAKGTMPADAARLEPYLPALGAFMTDLTARQQEQDGDPQPVADALVRLVEAPAGTRARRTVVGPAVQVAALDELDRVATETARIVGADMGIAAHLR